MVTAYPDTASGNLQFVFVEFATCDGLLVRELAMGHRKPDAPLSSCRRQKYARNAVDQYTCDTCR